MNSWFHLGAKVLFLEPHVFIQGLSGGSYFKSLTSAQHTASDIGFHLLCKGDTLTNFSIFAMGQYLFLASSERGLGSKWYESILETKHAESTYHHTLLLIEVPSECFLQIFDRHFMWLSLTLSLFFLLVPEGAKPPHLKKPSFLFPVQSLWLYIRI